MLRIWRAVSLQISLQGGQSSAFVQKITWGEIGQAVKDRRLPDNVMSVQNLQSVPNVRFRDVAPHEVRKARQRLDRVMQIRGRRFQFEMDLARDSHAKRRCRSRTNSIN